MERTVGMRGLRWLGLLVGMLVGLAACTPPFNAELQYISSVFGHVQRTLATVNALQGLAAEPRLGDAAWEAEAETQIATLRGLIAEAQGMTPPPNLASFHASYLAQMSRLEQVVATYDQAMSVRNNAALQQAQQRLQEAGVAIEGLRQQLEGLQNSQ